MQLKNLEEWSNEAIKVGHIVTHEMISFWHELKFYWPDEIPAAEVLCMQPSGLHIGPHAIGAGILPSYIKNIDVRKVCRKVILVEERFVRPL
jgi:hypothetical protein